MKWQGLVWQRSGFSRIAAYFSALRGSSGNNTDAISSVRRLLDIAHGRVVAIQAYDMDQADCEIPPLVCQLRVSRAERIPGKLSYRYAEE